jgi:hypothetical protein
MHDTTPTRRQKRGSDENLPCLRIVGTERDSNLAAVVGNQSISPIRGCENKCTMRPAHRWSGILLPRLGCSDGALRYEYQFIWISRLLHLLLVVVDLSC